MQSLEGKLGVRKLSYPAAALATVLSITACGGGSSGGSVSTAGDVPLVAAPAPAPAPAPSASPAPSPTPTPTPPPAIVQLPPKGGYVISPTLDGAEPLLAGFDVKKGLKSTGIPGNYSDTKGAFRFICGGKGVLAKVDPIVFPGEIGKSHLHQSWGNADFRAETTPDTIRQSALTDCNETPYSLNRSLYWQPALVNDQNQAIQPDLAAIYYKQWASNTGPCTPGSATYIGQCVNIPNKIRFVFGWDETKPTAKVQGAAWVCSGGSQPSKHYTNLDDVFASGCGAGDTLTANTMAPNCWDGKYLDTPDHRSHTAYAYYDKKGRYLCPSTHPYTIPQQENKVQWTVTADMVGKRADGTIYSRVRLTSDHMLPGAKAGETLHADYMEGWVWEAKKMWYDNCIEKRLNCSAGVLGNGYKMLGAEMPTYGWKNPSPRVNLNSLN